eukprot:sb/3462668/
MNYGDFEVLTQLLPSAMIKVKSFCLLKTLIVSLRGYRDLNELNKAPKGPQDTFLKFFRFFRNFKHFFRIFCQQSGKTGRFPAPRRVEPKQTMLKNYIPGQYEKPGVRTTYVSWSYIVRRSHRLRFSGYLLVRQPVCLKMGGTKGYALAFSIIPSLLKSADTAKTFSLARLSLNLKELDFDSKYVRREGYFNNRSAVSTHTEVKIKVKILILTSHTTAAVKISLKTSDIDHSKAPKLKLLMSIVALFDPPSPRSGSLNKTRMSGSQVPHGKTVTHRLVQNWVQLGTLTAHAPLPTWSRALSTGRHLSCEELMKRIHSIQPLSSSKLQEFREEIMYNIQLLYTLVLFKLPERGEGGSNKATILISSFNFFKKSHKYGISVIKWGRELKINNDLAVLIFNYEQELSNDLCQTNRDDAVERRKFPLLLILLYPESQFVHIITTELINQNKTIYEKARPFVVLEFERNLSFLNERAVPVIRYGAGILDWSTSKASGLDEITRKILRRGVIRYNSDADLYVSRKLGGSFRRNGDSSRKFGHVTITITICHHDYPPRQKLSIFSSEILGQGYLPFVVLEFEQNLELRLYIIILVGPFALRANFEEMVAGLGNADITISLGMEELDIRTEVKECTCRTEFLLGTQLQPAGISQVPRIIARASHMMFIRQFSNFWQLGLAISFLVPSQEHGKVV